MDIDEIKKEVGKRLSLLYAVTDHGKFFMSPILRAQIIEVFLNTEIVPERECAACSGTGIDPRYRNFHSPCSACNGTGKYPSITLEQAIKRVVDG